MKSYYQVDPWSIVEDQFDPSMQKASESIFSLGNGRMGQRANFEEAYSGPSLQGNYIAGVYYPDKTRVGWWKNGYPEFFAKVLNAPNWIGIRVEVDGAELDLHKVRVIKFRRELNMKEGFLERTFRVKLDDNKELEVHAKRFLSMAEDEIAAITYSIRPLHFSAEISLLPYIDGNVRNEDANYDEVFWDLLEAKSGPDLAYLAAETKKSSFSVSMAMKYELFLDGHPHKTAAEWIKRDGIVGARVSAKVPMDAELSLIKYVSVVSSLNYDKEHLTAAGIAKVEKAFAKKHDHLFDDHKKVWAANWSRSDIVIEGDEKAQQAIRFNIFQLNQTYSGKDERLNIGPKGFTGEKYGGSTYWDTEAYLLSFFLSTAPAKVARNLLIYRYKHLSRAIENAALLGFKDGAALYPMVTMDGRECHNEWEITFEEIHRNGAIAYAIFNYIRYTGDRNYLHEYGLEVLIALCRFWKQRVNWSDEKRKYVILGVTGPNEYENNINNNWYTNLMAKWTLEYTLEVVQFVKERQGSAYREIKAKTHFNEEAETGSWKKIIRHMYFPFAEEKNIFLQQDGYLDKEQLTAADIEPAERPINQHWSWDRILRSPFIKQADVLQGLYFFEDNYDQETLRRNFDYYEPRTVHESSLSPCIHSILASKLGKTGLAYGMYLRTSRLDLDDYNKEVAEGLHITSMGGTWMSVIYGFGGLRVKNEKLHLNPMLPGQWTTLSFRIIFRDNFLNIGISRDTVTVENEHGPALRMMLFGREIQINQHSEHISRPRTEP